MYNLLKNIYAKFMALRFVNFRFNLNKLRNFPCGWGHCATGDRTTVYVTGGK